MDNQQHIEKSSSSIDSYELLMRFLLKCKNESKKDECRTDFISSCADIVTATYYYRRYPNVNDFINKYLKEKQNYFHLQWARKTWAKLSEMSESDISDLVINQICMVDNSDEEQ